MAAGSFSLPTVRTFDKAGRLTSVTTGVDDGTLKTLYEYAQVSGSGRKISIYRDYPPAATAGTAGVRDQITEYYADGQVKKVSGSTVIEARYDYGADEDAVLRTWTLVTRGPTGSTRTEKTYRDMLSRVKRVERPGWTASGNVTLTTEYHYGSGGRLARVESPGQADTLYQYDDLGNLIRTALDVDGDESVDLAGPDRVSETQTTIEEDNGAYWQVTATSQYATPNDDTPTLTGSTRTRLTGFTGDDQSLFVAGETVSRDIHENETRTTAEIERTKSRRLETTDTIDSTQDLVRDYTGGRLMSSISSSGIETTYAYDALGRRTAVTDGRGNTSYTYYDDSGRVNCVEDGAGNQTEYGYYPGTDEQAEEEPQANAGRLWWVENPGDKRTYFSYNDRGQIVHTWGHVPYPTEQAYDDDYGERTALRTYRGGSGWGEDSWPASPGTADETAWAYDEATGLLEAKTYADDTEVNYTYTADGRLYTRQWARHASNEVTTYEYDEDTGELTDVLYPDSTTDLAYTYDRAGRRATVSDAAGTRTFAYDANSLELATETFDSGLFDGLVMTQVYEDGTGVNGVDGRWAGLLVGTESDSDAHYAAYYGHDALGRLDHVVGPGLPGGSGEDNGAWYTFLTDEQSPPGNVADLVRQLEFRDSAGDVLGWTQWSYEANRDLLTAVENNFGPLNDPDNISTYAYGNDSRGRRTHVIRTGIAFDNGQEDHLDLWTYDDRNELTGSTRYADTDPVTPENPVDALSFGYTYDPIGNRITHAEGEAPEEADYTANALNQYERVDVTAASEAVLRQGYHHDLDGNLADEWIVGDANCDSSLDFFDIDSFTAAVFNPNSPTPPSGYGGDQDCWDRRLEWGDVNGDQSLDFFDIDPFLEVLFAPAAIARTFVWDAENRLIEVRPSLAEGSLPTDGSALRISFKYDYLGRRVQKKVEAWTAGSPASWQVTALRRYVWNGWLPVLELDAADENAVLRKFTWGRDLSGTLDGAGGIGGLLAVHDTTVSTGVDYVFCYDANGNVGQIIDLGETTAAASLKARYEHDPYGRVIGPDDDDDGDWRDDAGAYASTNAWRFSTKQWEDETGLGYWGYRYYDPRRGRWINHDPIEEHGGPHLYAYVGNTPVGTYDRLGQEYQLPPGSQPASQPATQPALPFPLQCAAKANQRIIDCLTATQATLGKPSVAPLWQALQAAGCAPGIQCFGPNCGGSTSAVHSTAGAGPGGTLTICQAPPSESDVRHELIHAWQKCPGTNGGQIPTNTATNHACWEYQAYLCQGTVVLPKLTPQQSALIGCMLSLAGACATVQGMCPGQPSDYVLPAGPINVTAIYNLKHVQWLHDRCDDAGKNPNCNSCKGIP